ncbi:hypothetical protein [Streptomyces mirabilis]
MVLAAVRARVGSIQHRDDSRAVAGRRVIQVGAREVGRFGISRRDGGLGVEGAEQNAEGLDKGPVGTVNGEQVAVVDVLVFSEQQLRDARGDGETGRLGGGPLQGPAGGHAWSDAAFAAVPRRRGAARTDILRRELAAAIRQAVVDDVPQRDICEATGYTHQQVRRIVLAGETEMATEPRRAGQPSHIHLPVLLLGGDKSPGQREPGGRTA